MNQICSKCKEEKELTLFCKDKRCKNGHTTICKSCQSIYYKNYKEANKEKIAFNKRLYSQKNKSKLNKYRNEYKKQKRKTNVTYRLNGTMSCVIRDSLRGTKSNKTWSSMVNYSIEELKLHLESKFTNGMSWENYGKDGWHIDHIIPVSYFTYNSYDDPAFQVCWALSNLQPLWATTTIAISYGESPDYIGNIEKGNSINIHVLQEK